MTKHVVLQSPRRNFIEDEAEVTTTGATVETLYTLPLEDQKTYFVRVLLSARDQATAKHPTWSLEGKFYRDGAGAVAGGAGTQTSFQDAADAPLATVGFAVSGNNVLVQATPGEVITYHWKVQVEHWSVS